MISFIEIELIELPYRKIKQREICKGEFTEKNIGGNILSPNFLANPKYLLTVKEKDDYHFKVEGPKASSLMIVIIPIGDLNLTKQHLATLPLENFVYKDRKSVV